MKILIIANYVSFPWEIGNCRFMYLANLLSEHSQVELITSDFCHIRKEKRKFKENQFKKMKFKVTLISEKGYYKNVSLKRIYSHKVLAKNLKKYLNNLNYKPNVIYCAIPSIDVANVAVRYANKNNIRFIIDIQDLWPEAFKMVINIPKISDILFYPMYLKANYIYSHADDIVAVSQTYVDRALEVNKKLNKGLSVFLGTDLEYFDKCVKDNKIDFNDDIIRIAYIGTLGTSYDIKGIIDSIKILNDKGIDNIKFIVMGDGPLKNNFEEYAKEKKINCEFTGRLDYDKMVGLLCGCDIAVNPIVETSVASIINKVGDYAAAGLPVINTQNSEEYKKLLKKYNSGLNCKNGNIEEIVNSLELLICDEKLRKKMGEGNRKLAQDFFDRKIIYNRIIDLINNRD